MLVTALSAGCLGTETGNPGKTISLSLTAKTSEAKVASSVAGQGGLLVTSAWLSVKRIELVTCGSQTQTDTLLDELTRDFVKPDKALKVTVPEGTYCAIRVQVAPSAAPPSGAPTELQNASFWLSGRRTDDINVVARSEAVFTAELRSPNALRFDSNLLLAIDLARVFQNVPVNGMNTTGPNGIRIDRNVAPDLAQRLEDNLPKTLALHPDVNGNGIIDAEDQQAIAEPPP
jgi:hypothetical protein